MPQRVHKAVPARYCQVLQHEAAKADSPDKGMFPEVPPQSLVRHGFPGKRHLYQQDVRSCHATCHTRRCAVSWPAVLTFLDHVSYQSGVLTKPTHGRHMGVYLSPITYPLSKTWLTLTARYLLIDSMHCTALVRDWPFWQITTGSCDNLFKLLIHPAMPDSTLTAPPLLLSYLCDAEIDCGDSSWLEGCQRPASRVQHSEAG